MSTPFRVMLRMEIRPETTAEFERVWLSVGDAVTGHPANLAQWLLRSAEEPHVYYIVSDWSDEPSFRRFERSPEHLAHRTKLHPYRTAGSMITMNVVHQLTGAAAANA